MGLTKYNPATKEGMVQPRVDTLVSGLFLPRGGRRGCHALTVLRHRPVICPQVLMAGLWHLAHGLSALQAGRPRHSRRALYRQSCYI